MKITTVFRIAGYAVRDAWPFALLTAVVVAGMNTPDAPPAECWSESWNEAQTVFVQLGDETYDMSPGVARDLASGILESATAAEGSAE